MSEIPPGLFPMKEYTRSKQSIAHEVRTLSEFLKQHLGEREAEACRSLMAKLVEDRFTLAVVGQYKRGKSTLMNALIGRDLLPTGVLPLTSAITVLTYGPRDRLTIAKEGTPYPERVPVADLADYVTERGNPGNTRKVARAVLEVPSPFLRRGLEFVDTPGIGSNIEANTATTHAFVPQSDAVVFVTGVESPMTRPEIEFLRSVREHVRKIFFVVNKMDLVPEAERQTILRFVSETIEKGIGADQIRLFPLSSRMALDACLEGREDAPDQSGLKPFQEALCDFLVRERNNVFLISVLDKLLRLTGDTSRQLGLLKLACETSREEGHRVIKTLEKRFEVLRANRARALLEAQDRLILWARDKIGAVMTSFSDAESHTVTQALHEELSRDRWKPAWLVSQRIAKRESQRVREDLKRVTDELMEELEPQFVAALRQESVGLVRDLQEIRNVSLDALNGQLPDPSAETEEPGPPISGVLMRPNAPTVQWAPKVPPYLVVFPVLAVRSSLERVLVTDLNSLLRGCGASIEGHLLGEVREALGRLGAEIEKRALEIESQMVQAIKGRRLARGIDGQWRITKLDPAELAREIEMLAGIEKRLERIRSGLLPAPPSPSESSTPAVRLDPSEVPAREPKDEAARAAFEESEAAVAERSDFVTDCNTRGCPVCNRLIDVAYRFYASWQHALATEDRAQQEYAASFGFCPLHTWQLAAIASPRGLSQGYPAFMERLSAELSRKVASEDLEADPSVPSLVQTSRNCRVCRRLSDVERTYLEGLAAFVQTEEGRRAYGHSQGVCLRHLDGIIARVPSRELKRFLLEHAARRFAEISEDMQNYALKRDALSGNVPNQDEADAYLRGLVLTVGARQVCFPWEQDAEI